MANTDKNILITPNTGSATDDPSIVFSGADGTTAAQNVTLRVYPTNNGTLSFEGTAGQLFSITNNLTGTIYSVNDVSGIPSIEVLDDGTVKIAQYSGNTLIGTGTDNTTDKLQLAGTMAVNTNGYITFGPNSTWGSSLRIGGNGRTATGTEMASVVTTDGNLHLDAAASVNGIYLNYYAGTSGTLFGNGASGVVAVMGPDGDLWKGSADNSGSKYWHAGNDGSGSTLDADLLDGNHASAFEPANANIAKINVAQSWTAQQTFKELADTVYSLTGTSIDPANGAIQYKTLAANTTFTEALENGQSVVLRIDGGATYTITWPAMTWITPGGNVAPTLNGTKDVIVLWQESGVVYGAYVGYGA